MFRLPQPWCYMLYWRSLWIAEFIPDFIKVIPVKAGILGFIEVPDVDLAPDSRLRGNDYNLA